MPCEKKMVYYVPDANAKTSVFLPTGESIKATILDTAVNGARLGYEVHWTTCPGAKRFKK